jgi:hypothetical protein
MKPKISTKKQPAADKIKKIGTAGDALPIRISCIFLMMILLKVT